MENERARVLVPRHLKVGLATIGLAVGCIAAVLVLGWPWGCFLWMLMFVVLLYGWVSVLSGLWQRPNRRGLRLGIHVGLLLAMPVLMYLGHFLHLLDIRTRFGVALTGGQGELQAWAITILEKRRDHESIDGDGHWRVPREEWSEQVRRLKPGIVYVDRVFENGQEGVCLAYGAGSSIGRS